MQTEEAKKAKPITEFRDALRALVHQQERVTDAAKALAEQQSVLREMTSAMTGLQYAADQAAHAIGETIPDHILVEKTLVSFGDEGDCTLTRLEHQDAWDLLEIAQRAGES
ncbi:hypothetical protein [Pseudomonas alloputida]|uniref:hypothetical protein n=1 Tax=Pseudomonas alloputida TaxID=1940621 RepID=UPI001E61EF64|nr:hypothetical protein [Pseudomonas alloputida]MCE1054089.1 hypothetical protein [Pseudomonas alloputida]